MDAIQLLIDQHRTLESLLKKALDENEAKAAWSLFTEAADQLTVHIASEEQIFYPAIKAVRTEDILLESLEEHLSLKRLLADLLALNPTKQTFEPKLKVLKEQAEHHHKEEEENLFPNVKKMLNQVQREELGKRMMALQVALNNRGDAREAVVEETDVAAPLM